jgi:3-hydroxyacyl-CoA dehydrogenase
MYPLTLALSALSAVAAFTARLRAAADDRGDVPGWVLVTVMTAGLVTAIWLVADGQLTSVLDRAISSVSQP